MSFQLTASEKALIFLHIPKTAGSTLSSIIDSQYPPGSVHSITGDRFKETTDQFLQMAIDKKRKLRCLKGHLPFGMHEHLSKPSEYVTIIRNPIERVISEYYYIHAENRHHLHTRVVESGITLEQFVQDGLVIYTDNCQVRLISGVGHHIPYGHCSEDALSRAKDNLDKYFSVVGVQDRFDESVLLMAQQFGWRLKAFKPLNVNRARPREISAAARALVQKHNELDVELYRYARRRFERDLAAQVWPVRHGLVKLHAARCAHYIREIAARGIQAVGSRLLHLWRGASPTRN